MLINSNRRMLENFNILFKFFVRIFDIFKKRKEKILNIRANSLIDCSDCERFMTEEACVDCPYKKNIKGESILQYPLENKGNKL